MKKRKGQRRTRGRKKVRSDKHVLSASSVPASELRHHVLCYLPRSG